MGNELLIRKVDMNKLLKKPLDRQTNKPPAPSLTESLHAQKISTKNRKVIQSIAFFLILIVGLQILSRICLSIAASHYGEGLEISHRTRAARVLDAERPNSIDVIAIGNSVCMNTVVPQQIWDATGISSAVASQPGMTLMESYRAFQQAVTTQSPKVILFETDVLYYGGNLSGIKSITLDQVHRLFPVFLYHSIWRQMAKKSPEDPIGSHGFLPTIGVSPYVGPPRDMTPTAAGEDFSLTYKFVLDQITKECKERDIKLVLYSTPNAMNFSGGRHTSLQQYADAHGISYIDFNQPEANCPIDWNQDTIDGGEHLNPTGAAKLTAALLPYLTQMNLPDHRQDSSYQSWNQ